MADAEATPPSLTLPLLASPEDLAVALGTTASEPRVTSALRRASARFRAAVHWRVDAATATVRLDGHGRRSLRLPAREVTACSVTLAASATQPARLLVDGVDFEWSPDGIIDRLGDRWPDRRRAVEVTFTAGYDPVPDDVQEAVLDQAAAIYRIKRGLSSKQVGGITETYGSQEATGTTEQWVTAVAAYRVGTGDRA